MIFFKKKRIIPYYPIMVEINYKTLKGYLKDMNEQRVPGHFAPVYLIYGDEFLCKNALDALLTAMIPGARRDVSYEALDGSNDNIREAIMRVNTYALLSGKRIVAVCDSKIFYSKQDENKLLAKAKEAYDDNDLDLACKLLLNFMGLSKLAYDDLRGENRKKILKFVPESPANGQWLDEIIDYCRDNDLPIPPAEDNADILRDAIEKGFPRENHLIITTDMVDKRRLLYKAIEQKGVIIDCSLPKGDRRADKINQEAALKEKMNDILDRCEKTIDAEAFQAMVEMIGFDLRTFIQNLEKLISYVGEKKQIQLDDVRSVVERTKKDPIYELTNAIADRNLEGALFYIHSLLTADFHPLQILAAVTNQIRKLLLVKAFVKSPQGVKWQRGRDYGHFKTLMLPAMENYDQDLLGMVENWEDLLFQSSRVDGRGSAKKETRKKKETLTDLFIAKNSKNPYPIYQLLLKSEKYSTMELIAALECLKQADLRLKSTRQRPKLILEEAVFRICRQVNVA